MSLVGPDSADPRAVDEPEGEAPPLTFGEDAREWTEVGLWQGKRLAMDDVIDAALQGKLPRSRPLKPYEPDKLNPVHIEMLFMRACGIKQARIAKLFGTDDSRVSIIMNHPDARFLLGKILSHTADEVIDIDTRLKAMRAESVDTLAELMRSGKEENRTRIAFGILDRTGHGKETKQKISHEINIPVKHAGLLSAAMAESEGIVEAEWCYVEGEQSGNGSLLSPAGHGSPGVAGSVSGPQSFLPSESDAGAPPTSDSQQQRAVA